MSERGRHRLWFISNLFPDQAEPYRGLDNVTILHRLASDWEIKVVALRPSLKAWWSKDGCNWQPRPEDQKFHPRYIGARYLPKVGDGINHRLMNVALEKVVEEVRREKVELILASWLYPDGWAAMKLARRCGVPLVLIAQGSDVHSYLRMEKRRPLILEAVAGSIGVITRSRSLAVLLEEAGVPSSKLKPIANGVDTEVFRSGDQEEERQRLDIPKEAKVLLFVGNLLPVKDPGLMLEAFASLRKRHPEWPLQLMFAGKGPLRESLEKQVEELGLLEQVKFLGPLKSSEVARWMRAADLLCMTSRNEGLPNVLLEAMACGLPVIATDVGGIKEAVDEPWKGRLVASRDKEAFATAVEDLLEAPLDRDRIAAHGKSLSWEATQSAYQRVLEQAMNENDKNLVKVEGARD